MKTSTEEINGNTLVDSPVKAVNTERITNGQTPSKEHHKADKTPTKEGHHHSRHHHKHKHKHKHHDTHDKTPVKNNSEEPISRIRNSDIRMSPDVRSSPDIHNSPCKIDDDPISHNSIKILGKKRVLNNCGIQVCLKRRTENKCIQVSFKSKDHHSSSYSSKSDRHHDKARDHKMSIETSREHNSTSSSKPSYKSKDHMTSSHSVPSESLSKPITKSSSSHTSIESSSVNKPAEKSKDHISSHTSNSKHHDKSNKTPRSDDRTKSLVDLMQNKNLESSKDYRYRKLKSAKYSDEPFSNSKFRKLFHLEKCPNGGALVLHVYQDELRNLTDDEMTKFVAEYFDFVYGENPEGVSNCVMGIVHRSAIYMPDFISYFAEKHPTMHCKAGMMGKSDIDSTTISKYQENMFSTYNNGTHRSGPLMQISVVGTVHEEVGDYFPDFLDMVEKNPFLRVVMPWGERSVVAGMARNYSNDGPILWSRPGEQMVPTADMPKSPFKKKRYVVK